MTKAKATVLIVDDSTTNLQVMAAILEQRYQVKAATSGEQCIAIATKHRPDLILLDVVMPDMDGFAVCEKLQSLPETKSIPIIFVTGRDEVSDEEQGLRLGAVDYITKPIRPLILSARVDTHITLKQQQDKLHELAMIDQLTGLTNRHYMLEVVGQKLARSRRHETPLSIMMIDIDHFKEINDTSGHLTGDLVLRQLGEFLKDQFRVEDSITRFGGEEFLVILEPCNEEQAIAKAEEIRKDIEKLQPANIDITVSIGVAQLSNRDLRFDQLIKRADKALYEAKGKGRNCTVLSSLPKAS